MSITAEKKFFDLEERHDNTDTNLSNDNFFSNNFIADVFLFITAIISLLVTTLVLYLLCKHKKLRTLVASLALQQIKEVGAVATKEEFITACTFKNSVLYNFGIKHFNFWPSDFHSSTLQKTKTVQGMFILKCS